MTATDLPWPAEDLLEGTRETPEPAPPVIEEAQTPAIGREAFRVLNRWFMGPALRSGLGAWVATPIGGYILLLRVTGRRSGLPRETPLTYLIAEGSVWVAAAFGSEAEWFRNAMYQRRVEVILPGRSVLCIAQEVRDEATRQRIGPQFVRVAGFPAFLAGINPWNSTPEQMMRAMTGVPLVRLRPLGSPIVAGPDDPGGQAWIWRQALIALVSVVGARQLLRLLGRLF